MQPAQDHPVVIAKSSNGKAEGNDAPRYMFFVRCDVASGGLRELWQSAAVPAPYGDAR